MAALICAAGAAAAGWVVAGGGPLVSDLPDWLPMNTASASADAGGKAQLKITSQPDNATVFVDGGQKGKTPLSLAVFKGAHTLMLTDSAAVDNQRQLNVTTDMDVSVSMWRRRPDAMQLKPAYPGASISGAGFLADGRLALSMAMADQTTNPDHHTLSEAWIFDPTSGKLVPFTPSPSNPRAAIVLVSPDASNLAYVQPNQSDAQTGMTRPRLDEVLVAGTNGAAPPVRVFTLPSVSTNPASASATTSEAGGA
jgi:PEGA domain